MDRSPFSPHAGVREPALDQLLRQKKETLADILGAISREITARTDLSHAIAHQLQEHYLSLRSELLTLQREPLRWDTRLDPKRAGLEARLDRIHEEKRHEHTQAWRDISHLTEEFRKWIKQYHDLVQRLRLLGIGQNPAPAPGPSTPPRTYE